MVLSKNVTNWGVIINHCTRYIIHWNESLRDVQNRRRIAESNGRSLGVKIDTSKLGDFIEISTLSFDSRSSFLLIGTKCGKESYIFTKKNIILISELHCCPFLAE